MTYEIVARPHQENFIKWAKDKPNVLVLSADLTNSCEVGKWRDTYPDRFFSMGMAEQNMLGYAAGLAREGFEPWLHTFSVFLYRRPLDQLQMSIAYPALKVRLVGFLPGIMTPRDQLPHVGSTRELSRAETRSFAQRGWLLQPQPVHFR